MNRDKAVDPKDPKSGAETEREQGPERQTKGYRFKWRKLFRRVGRRSAWSDVAIKERIVDISW